MDDRPIVIVDLDGTLANLDHRLHLVNNVNDDPDFKPDWDTFTAACIYDEPNWPVVKTVRALYKDGCEIWIFSGRMDTAAMATEQWLSKDVADVPWNMIKMRDEGDFTKDSELKESWLQNMLVDDRDRILLVIDDRDSVVKMWRRNGLVCLQVAKGDF